MGNQLLIEKNLLQVKVLKKEIIKESKKHKGFCDINGKGLLNVIYFLDKLNSELNILLNLKNKKINLKKTENFYKEIINSLNNVNDYINDCRFLDFDNENYLKICKYLDENIKQHLTNLINFNKKHLNQILLDINKYKLFFNIKLKESTSSEKIIGKYSFN